MSAKMALRRFALGAAAGYRGRDAGETFARDLMRCFWPVGSPEQDDGPGFAHSFSVVDGGKRSKRTVSAYWATRRLVVDVVERDLMLDIAWSELLRACLQMEAEPQYVLLTNQRDVRLYDLARDRAAPRLSIALDEIPKYSEAFPFFEPDWVPGTTPKIINVDKVSKEVADLVAKVYRALKAKHEGDGDDVIRFTLQCIVSMFAEDIGLLPKEYFTTLLYQIGEGADSTETLGRLFDAMASSDKNADGIPFFNGGLFTDPVALPLSDAPLRALTKAAEANWTFVDPHIFGSVFQGIMDDDERHASGGHYTAREDIMSVVGPTIIEPWRERIEAAKTLEDLRSILKDLSTYRVLDPACGSGNFLYVAFRELYRLETEVLVRIYDEFPSATKGKGKVSWASGIRTTSFFGIDINAFAVELAKTTLNIAKKIAFEQRKEEVIAKLGQFSIEVDPSLPLDNLDDNILCADALFSEWPEADAIVGNPPFLGGKKFIEQLGIPYHARLRNSYPLVEGMADLCTHWFRRAHDALGADARAGLIATSTIRYGATARCALDYLANNGGTIHDAVAQRAWPGDAAVAVSIVNWVRGPGPPGKRLTVEGRTHVVSNIPSSPSLTPDITGTRLLGANSQGTGCGIDFGTTKAFPQSADLHRIAADPASRGVLRSGVGGGDILAGTVSAKPQWVVFFGAMTLDEAKRASEAFSYFQRLVWPEIESKSSRPSNAGWENRWWQARRFGSVLSFVDSGVRMIGCSQTMSRPIYFFLSTAFRPSNKVQLFGFDDDYTFGIIQSSLHWVWVKAQGGRIKTDPVYRTRVWTTFPWPQEPTLEDVVAVARAAQQLRATRDRLMGDNGWSLRDLYRSAEVAGPHPLKDAQAALDAAVEAAYGKPADQEATEFLLEMNLALAADEAGGIKIQGPGLPKVNGKDLDPKNSRWFSTDCIEPPPLPGLDGEVAGA